MKIIILYASKSGNTKKIADSMASELGCEAIRITAETNPASIDLAGYDLILVGAGLYAGTPNEDIVNYLSRMKLQSKKQFALFITWGGAPRSDQMALSKLRTLLVGKGQTVLEDHFASYGGWKGILMKRGHPKPEEIKAAAVWAAQIKEKLQKVT